MSNNLPNRSLREVVDLTRKKLIAAEDLLNFGPDEVDLVRKTCRSASNAGEVVYICRKCEHPAYLQHDLNKRPMWAHRPRAPKGCEWYTGDPASEDAVNANKFHGNQESKIHLMIKQEIASILESDQQTELNSVIVDQYLIGANGRRRPDVRATYGGKPIAIEVQLATTLLPTIVDRAEFYKTEERHLIWVTYSSSATNFETLRVAFRDIYYEHSKCLFSVDNETFKQSRDELKLYFRATWFRDGKNLNKIISLDELKWPAGAPPYLHPPIPDKLLDWRKKWRATVIPFERKEEIKKLIAQGLQEKEIEDEKCWVISEAISTFDSVVEGKPQHSAQNILIEKLNTFLTTIRHHEFANLLKHAVRFSDHRDLLKKQSLKKKIHIAENAHQLQANSVACKLITKLFPEWF